MRIDIEDKFDQTCTELLVKASLDSGGRGRPRVIYDVTAALSKLGKASLLPKNCRSNIRIYLAPIMCVT